MYLWGDVDASGVLVGKIFSGNLWRECARTCMAPGVEGDGRELRGGSDAQAGESSGGVNRAGNRVLAMNCDGGGGEGGYAASI